MSHTCLISSHQNILQGTTSGATATIGGITLQITAGSILLAKLDPSWTPLWANNTGPTNPNDFYIYLGFAVAPNERIYMGGE